MTRTCLFVGTILVILAGSAVPASAAGDASSSPICAASSSTPSPTSSPAPSPAVSPSESPSPTAAGLCEQQRLLAEVRKRLSANLATALAVQDQLKQSLDENVALQAALESRIDDSRKEEAALDSELARLADAVAASQRRISADRSQAASLARSVYMSPDSFLLLLVGSGSLKEAVVRVSDTLAAGSRTASDERLVNGDLANLRVEESQAMEARRQKARVEAALVADNARLAELRRTQEESSRHLADQIDRTRAEISNAEKQSADLAQRISSALDAEQAEIIARAVRQVWAQVLVWEQSGASGRLPFSSTHSTVYPFVWPEPRSVVSQGFGPTDFVLEPSYGGSAHFHTGIDLAAPALTPVLAADDGLVAIVGASTSGYGNFVVLGHRNGLVTLYAHLAQALVKPGEDVTQGEPIGLEGSTGYSTGPHLHFEVRLGDQPVDPALYLPVGPPSPLGLGGG